MKIFVAILALVFCFTGWNNLSAQKSTPFQVGKTLSVKQLKEGTNYVRLKSTRLKVVKKGSKLRSIQAMNPGGGWGTNILKARPNGETEFTCIGHICFCHGDNDCNDMFTTNVCSEDINDAACVGETCACVRDRN